MLLGQVGIVTQIVIVADLFTLLASVCVVLPAASFRVAEQFVAPARVDMSNIPIDN